MCVCGMECGLTVFTQSSPEAQLTQTDVAVGTVGEAAPPVGTGDQITHTVTALTWHPHTRARTRTHTTNTPICA